jgi:hypothetical protein
MRIADLLRSETSDLSPKNFEISTHLGPNCATNFKSASSSSRRKVSRRVWVQERFPLISNLSRCPQAWDLIPVLASDLADGGPEESNFFCREFGPCDSWRPHTLSNCPGELHGVEVK